MRRPVPLGPISWRVILCVTILPAWWVSAQTQNPGQPTTGTTLTLEAAVQEAISHNLDLLAERYNLPVARTRIITAGLRPNPVLTLDADHLDLLGTGFNLTTNNGGPSEYSVRTDFLFERGGKRKARLAVAEANLSVTELQLLNTVRQLVLDVDNAFVDLQAANDNLQLARENLNALHNAVQIDQVRVRSGDLAEVELLRAQVAELQYENSVRQAELRVRTAQSKLQLLLGRESSAAPLQIAGGLRRDAGTLFKQNLLSQAFQYRPDLQAITRDQARSQADVRLQLAQGKIDYTLGAEYRAQTITAHANTLGFFLQTNLPVFNRNQGEIARARQEQMQIEARLRALHHTIENDVDIAYQQYTTAQQTLVRIESSMLGRARDVQRITEYSYRRGEATFVEFLDAQRAYNDTIQTYNDARADFARSLYSIESATGLSTVTIKAANP
jgi:outer membrane protein, heavy metal efflux system